MSVYVDQLCPTAVTRNWPFQAACHLTADTEEELHAFAALLGLKRQWCQYGTITHYDLTPAKRGRAVVAGAVQTTAREIVRAERARRKRCA